MKNILINDRMFRLVVLFAVIFASTVFSMDQMEKRAAQVRIMERQLQARKYHQSQQSPKKNYFIYEQGTNNGISVDREIANRCKAIQNMVGDMDGEIAEIPLNVSLDIIKLVFGVLRNKINVNKLSLEHLVNIANAFNFLDVSKDSMDLVLAAIKIDIDKNSETIVTNELLKRLYPDLQKMLMVVPATDYLQDFIIKNDLNGRKRVCVGHPTDVLSVAFSPDGKKIVSGCAGDNNNLIVWDVSDRNNITGTILNGHPGDVLSVAFTRDGMSIVSVIGAQNTIVLWDISDLSAITSHVLADYPEDVFAISTSDISFSLNSKKMVMIPPGNENNLIVRDVTNPQAITHTLLMGHPDVILSVAFSPDGTMIVSGCTGSEDNLIVWLLLTAHEESLINNIAHYSADQVRLVYQLCLQSSDGQKIILKQGSDEQKIFMTLPQDMQKLLTDLLFPKGFFYNWW